MAHDYVNHNTCHCHWIAEIWWESLRTRWIGLIPSHHSLVLANKKWFLSVIILAFKVDTGNKHDRHDKQESKELLRNPFCRSFKVTSKARCVLYSKLCVWGRESRLQGFYLLMVSCKMASYWVRHSKFSFTAHKMDWPHTFTPRFGSGQ